MLHTLVQTQPRPGTAKLPSVTRALRRAFALIHDLGVAHKAISAVTLLPDLRAEVVASGTRTGAALNSHAVAGSHNGGEHTVADIVGVASLVAVVGDRGIDRHRDVCVGLEDGHAVGAAAELC